MKSQRIASEGAVDTLVVVLDNGEEAFSALQTFVRNEGISVASLTAIGAFARATVDGSTSPASRTRRSRSVNSARC